MRYFSLCLIFFAWLDTYAAKPTYTNYTNEELIAAVLVAEAGGESVTGMKAVFEVIKTRAKEKQWTTAQVVKEPFAFSCLNKYRNNISGFIKKWKRHPRWQQALTIVRSHKGTQLSNAANYYHEKTVRPDWSRGEIPVARIGRHLFFALP